MLVGCSDAHFNFTVETKSLHELADQAFELVVGLQADPIHVAYFQEQAEGLLETLQGLVDTAELFVAYNVTKLPYYEQPWQPFKLHLMSTTGTVGAHFTTLMTELAGGMGTGQLHRYDPGRNIHYKEVSEADCCHCLYNWTVLLSNGA